MEFQQETQDFPNSSEYEATTNTALSLYITNLEVAASLRGEKKQIYFGCVVRKN